MQAMMPHKVYFLIFNVIIQVQESAVFKKYFLFKKRTGFPEATS